MMAMLRKFSSALPQALEIARYCTRINRTLQNRITNIIRKQVLQESLCDPAFTER